MKTIMNKVKTLWNDESAQGATEYILILVIVVAIAVMFGPKIKEVVSQKVSDLQSEIQSFKP